MTELKAYPLKPMHNNILIEKVDLVKRTILVDGKSDSENVAKVLAVGPGYMSGDKHIPVSVKPGDYIVVGGNFNKYRCGFKEFLIMSENSIVAVITDIEAVMVDENPNKDKIEQKSPAKSSIIIQ